MNKTLNLETNFEKQSLCHITYTFKSFVIDDIEYGNILVMKTKHLMWRKTKFITFTIPIRYHFKVFFGIPTRYKHNLSPSDQWSERENDSNIGRYA